MIFRDDRFSILELTNRKSAVLVDALEIESASCILEADRERYLTATWEERQLMDIPINWKSIARYRTQYEQLDVGSHPFVVPQDIEMYKVYGLQLVEPNNIL